MSSPTTAPNHHLHANLQIDFELKKLLRLIPVGHSTMKQDASPIFGPLQDCPRLFGAGFVHVLVLFFEPTPQITLQGPHSDHDDQPPSIKSIHICQEYNISEQTRRTDRVGTPCLDCRALSLLMTLYMQVLEHRRTCIRIVSDDGECLHGHTYEYKGSRLTSFPTFHLKYT